jgi:hypothetical protein
MNSKTMFALASLLPLIAVGAQGQETAEAAKKEEAKPLTSYTPGGGFKTNFDASGDSYIRLSGFARVRFDWTKDAEDPEYFGMDRFRLYSDLQTSKEWGAHFRFDYYPNFFLSTSNVVKNPDFGQPYAADEEVSTEASARLAGEDAAGTVSSKNAVSDTTFYQAAPYWARAYITYSPTDWLSLDFGRVLIDASRYQNAVKNLDVAHGIGATISYFDGLTTMIQANYKEKETRTNGGEPEPKSTWFKLRQEYSQKFGDVSLLAGVGMITNIDKRAAKEFRDIVADVKVSYEGAYFLNEFLYAVEEDADEDTVLNYAELGYNFTDELSVDVVDYYNKGAKSNSVTLEVGVTIDESKLLVPSVTVTETEGEDTGYSGSLSFTYYL